PVRHQPAGGGREADQPAAARDDARAEGRLMAGHGGGRRGGAHEEEHENHERWLVSYADMMTLLMVLFIVLFAISQVDQKKIAAALKAKGLQSSVRFKVTDRGLVVALVSDDVFFANASADLRPKGHVVVRAIGPVLRAVPQDIAVEGHANHLALRSSLYPSNWELSAARAGSVVRYLQSDDGLAARRLSATGYGP